MTDSSADNVARLLKSRSFVELGARHRARALLDEGSFRELLDPFDRVTSPWLPKQGIVTQVDDGVVVAKGTIDGQSAAQRSPVRWNWRSKTTARASRPAPCCCWKP